MADWKPSSGKQPVKLANPFAKPTDAKTPFAAVYASVRVCSWRTQRPARPHDLQGFDAARCAALCAQSGIPCRINHGGVKHSLVRAARCASGAAQRRHLA